MTSELNKDATEAVLIGMTIAGRNDCFSLLMDRHLAAVRNRLRFMVSNQADLDDLVQEVQLKAWRNLAAFRSESNLRTWMITIAINQARELFRRNKCRPVCEPLNHTFAVGEPPIDQEILRTEANTVLRRAVAKLPRKYEEVVVMRDLWELSGAETARRLDTTVQMVKTRLFRARHMLSANLRDSATLKSVSHARSDQTPGSSRRYAA